MKKSKLSKKLPATQKTLFNSVDIPIKLNHKKEIRRILSARDKK